MKNLKYTEKRDWIFLFIGIIFTALFIVFSTQIYELMYYESEFSNEMYNQNIYFLLAVDQSLTCWIILVLYYLIIDKFDRWYHWLFALLLILICTPSVTLIIYNAFDGTNYDFSNQIFNFNIIALFVSIILFFVVSFSIKRLSSNCSATPF